MRKTMLSVLLVLGLCLCCLSAEAQDSYGYEQPRRPSIFRYGYEGLLMGGLVGVSGGYLAARNHGEYRALGLGAGIGAVTGAGLGLSLGLVDVMRDDRPRVHLVLRDVLYGTSFGALTGAITGSLFVIDSGDPEHVAFGAAIGGVSGAGVGLVVGIFDALGVFERRDRKGSCELRRHDCHRHRYGAQLSATEDARGELVFMPAVAGRF